MTKTDILNNTDESQNPVLCKIRQAKRIAN